MPLTNFKDGIASMGVPVLGAQGFLTQGQSWFVKPVSGNDGNTGKTPLRAFKTMAKALSAAVADRNDVVYFFSEGNAAAEATDYQSATLDWNKDCVHIIGINAGNMLSQRSRIAFASAYDTASNLMTVSASGCLIANMQIYAGVAGTNPTGCLQVTGDRNHFFNCHIAGIGNDANDIAGAYSLKLDGADENLFEKCTIGLTTIARGTNANADILIDTDSKLDIWKDCVIARRIEHNTNAPLVQLADATSIQDFIMFDNCSFISCDVNYAYTNGGVFSLPALTAGYIIVKDSIATNASKWDVNDRDKIELFNSPTPAADTAGITRLV